jgi:hypothetical protein
MIVSDKNCKLDEHAVFNLTVLNKLKELGLDYKCDFNLDTFNFYSQYMYLQKAGIKELISAKRVLYLNANWKELFFSFFSPSQDILIFHNFFQFINGNRLKDIIRIKLLKILIKYGKFTPVVLSDHIAEKLYNLLHIKFSTMDLFYDRDVIDKLKSKRIMFDDMFSDFVVLGNLYPGKVDINTLNDLKPLHIGKLHGGFTYSNSIDKYVDIGDYYLAIQHSNNIIILYSDYSLIASGVIMDAIVMNKKIIGKKNHYLNCLVEKYNISLSSFKGEMIIIDTKTIYQKVKKDFNDKIIQILN